MTAEKDWQTHLQSEVDAENEREKQLVLLEERAADVGVKVVREVVAQVTKTLLQDLRLVAAEKLKLFNRLLHT